MPTLPTGKRQLAMAGLDGLGSSDRGDDVQLTHTAQVLVRKADVLINDYKKNMQRSGGVASGKGSDLVHASDIEINGSRVSLDIMLPEYLLFQNSGVKGVKGGTGKYSFKKGYPSRAMMANILKWVRRRSIRVDKYSPIKKAVSKKSMTKDRSVKKMRDEAADYKAMAYAISKSIMNKGIKPTHDFDKAIDKFSNSFKKELAAGFKLDVIENLK